MEDWSRAEKASRDLVDSLGIVDSLNLSDIFSTPGVCVQATLRDVANENREKDYPSSIYGQDLQTPECRFHKGINYNNIAIDSGHKTNYELFQQILLSPRYI